MTVLLVAACASDRSATSVAAPPAEPSVRIIDGDGQRAEAGTELPIDLAVRVADGKGASMAGVPVHFATQSGDLDPADVVTGGDGIARTSWTLGTRAGESQVDAAALDVGIATFTASAIAPLGSGQLSPLSIATYEGSGQVVHPDVARVPRRWGHGRRYLAITPYLRGENTWERPSIFSAGDLSSWMIPPQGKNPVVNPTTGYLSDPDVVYEPDARQLWLYYRAVDTNNSIWLMRSSDGAAWDAPKLVVRVPNHRLVSPSVVRVGRNEWHMWSVNAGDAGCGSSNTVVQHRTSENGIDWSPASDVDLGQSEQLSPWHLDVVWIPDRREYWALYNVKPAYGCNTPALYFATSLDGVHWKTYPSPVLERGAISQFDDVVYRSTLEYAPESDDVTLWYSGARYDQKAGWVWSAAVEKLHRSELFRVVMRTNALQQYAPSSAPILRDAP